MSNKKLKIFQQMNYFKLYLQHYMREHSFEQSDIASAFVEDRAELAAESFEQSRKAGYSVVGAMEIANRDLFTNVGASIWETAYDFLEEHFAQRIEIRRPLIHDFWTQKLCECREIWNEYLMEDGIGLNEELIELCHSDIERKIDQFLINHGL